MGGAERARIRGGCGPRGLAGQERERTPRATRGRGGRPRPPRGPPAPERYGARRGRTMAGAGRAGGELPRATRGGCRLHRLRSAGARLRGRRAEPHQARWTRRRSGVAAAEPLRRVGEPGAYQARPRGRGRSVPRRRGGAGPWRERSVGSAVLRAAPARGRAWEDARATTSGGVAGTGFPTKRGGRRTKATPSWPLAGVRTAGDLIRSPGPAEPGDRAKRHKGREEDRIMGLGTREPTKREPTESTDCTRA